MDDPRNLAGGNAINPAPVQYKYPDMEAAPRRTSTAASLRGRNTILLNEATMIGILNEWLARTMPANNGSVTDITVTRPPDPRDPTIVRTQYHVEISFDQPAFRVVPE